MHSLLGISDRLTMPIQIFHKSLPDFLFNPDRSGEYHISRKSCHLDLALGCLRWVKRDMFLHTQQHKRYDLLGFVPTPRISKGAYASRYWAEHCIEAEPLDGISVYLKTFDSFMWSGLFYCQQSRIEELCITIKWLKEVSNCSFNDNMAYGDRNLTF
jgi:hypothetical protein